MYMICGSTDVFFFVIYLMNFFLVWLSFKLPDGWLVEHRPRLSNSDRVDRVTFFSPPVNLVIYACIFALLSTIQSYHTPMRARTHIHTHSLCLLGTGEQLCRDCLLRVCMYKSDMHCHCKLVLQ